MPNNQTQSYFSQSNLWTDQIAPYQEQVLADFRCGLWQWINY